MARFVVDETSWQAQDLAPAAYVERIEQILDTIDDIVQPAMHASIRTISLLASSRRNQHFTISISRPHRFQSPK
jgi:hypothetical protein